MLVGICGKKRAGKDTVANILVEQYQYTRVAFADKLKSAANKMFGFIDLSEKAKELSITCWVHDRNVFDALRDLGLDRQLLSEYLKQFHLAFAAHIKYFTDTGCQMKISPRIAYQLLGTDFARAIDKDIWINSVDLSSERTVVSDVRFDNEASLIKGSGGAVIRIDNPRVEDDSTSGHISEQGVAGQYIDAVINNDGSIELLERNVKEVMEQLIK